MLRLSLLAAAAATLVAVPASAHNHNKAKPAAACAPIPANAANSLFDRFNAAWATKNPDTVADLFSSDAVLLATVSNTPRTDRAGIRDYFVSFLKGAPVGTRDTSNVREGCNMLTDVGTWTVALTNQNSGVRNNVKARYSFIYKYENGAWKIAHLHSSMMPISE
jgi:uncharacterized protein (TIGR02246 family)